MKAVVSSRGDVPSKGSILIVLVKKWWPRFTVSSIFFRYIIKNKFRLI